ncbi:MAG: hypothetical protein WDZ27_05260 [Waddliaceae bacterium]
MNKSNPNEPSELENIFEESSIVRFIVDNGKVLLISFLLGLFLIIALTQYFSGSGKPSPYLKAEREMQNLRHAVYTTDKIEESAAEMTSLLNRNPELQSKYDATVAQMLIGIGNENQAVPIARRALKRSQDASLKDYHDFAEVTLLIEQGNIAESLQKSKELKQTLTARSNLALYNVFRIAVLEQKLGNREEEQRAWQDLQTQLNENERPQDFIALFSDGDITLMDFIEERLKNQ